MNIEKTVAPVTRVSDGPLHHFFGYYDKSPWNRSGRYLLAMQSTFADRNPTLDDGLTIGRIDLEGDRKFQPLAETHAWNWQQGCMLRWMPGDNECDVLFNDCRGDRYVAVQFNTETGESRDWTWPVYDITRDGQTAVMMNFERITDTRPGYGYFGLPDPFGAEIQPKDDGLYVIDVATQERRMIFSLADAAELGNVKPNPGDKTWFNHAVFNASGTRLIFLHRWSSGPVPGHVGFFTRLLTIDPDGGRPTMLIEGVGISHYDWYDDNRIVVWLHSLDGKVDNYFIVDDPSGHRRIFGKGLFTVDGHCNFSPDRHWMVTDTYPKGPNNEQTLIVYDPQENRRIDLGDFASMPSEDMSWRCDLHPRWSADSTQICIDSTHEGTRQMYIVDVSDVTKKD